MARRWIELKHFFLIKSPLHPILLYSVIRLLTELVMFISRRLPVLYLFFIYSVYVWRSTFYVQIESNNIQISFHFPIFWIGCSMMGRNFECSSAYCTNYYRNRIFVARISISDGIIHTSNLAEVKNTFHFGKNNKNNTQFGKTFQSVIIWCVSAVNL